MKLKSVIESEYERLTKDHNDLLDDFSSFLKFYSNYILNNPITIEERKIITDYISELISIQNQIKLIEDIRTKRNQ